MTKLFFILAAVVTAVAIFFGFQNRTALIEARKAKVTANKAIKKDLAILDTKIEDIVGVQKNRKRAEGERDEQQQMFNSAKRKLATRKTESEGLDAQIKKYNAQYAAYEEELRKLPPGINIDTLEEDMNRLKQTLSDKQTELAALEKEIEVANDNIAKNTEYLDGQKERQVKRNESFDLNSLQARITAVNRDWGFVIVDVGATSGITMDTPLLVSRSSEPVAKLRIISLEPKSLIADIDFDSMPLASTVLPGDAVVLEKPNQ